MMREGITLQETIETLKEAGLNSVPGTAAEILDDRVRGIICPKKITSGEWVEIIKTCHLHGVPTTATMMYGHLETPAELVKHIMTLKEIQMETGGFTELVPLPIIPYNTELYRAGLVLSPPSLTHNLRVHAVARLMLAGCIDNIQASWVKLGPAGAQLMLNAGANDFSGTLMEENITRAAGGKLQSMTPEELRELILRAGRTPAQRTTTYEILS
jgi:CofH subfamily radical SAM domain protein